MRKISLVKIIVGVLFVFTLVFASFNFGQVWERSQRVKRNYTSNLIMACGRIAIKNNRGQAEFNDCIETNIKAIRGKK